MTDHHMTGSGPEGKNVPFHVRRYGKLKIDDVTIDCAVTESGLRGFLKMQAAQTIGIEGKGATPRFRHILGKIAPNSLISYEKTYPPVSVILPNGRKSEMVPYEWLIGAHEEIVDALMEGRLTKQQAHIGQHCYRIMKAYARVGLVALIDEATGYQYERAPDALQDLITRLICEQASDWKRRFHPDFYSALCKLFGFSYGNRHRGLPGIIGKITLDWVYSVILPPDILAELKARQTSEKLHQWLKADGLSLLEKQRDAVMMIARSSVDYRDFEARCSVAFYRPGQQTKMVFPAGAAEARP